MLNKWRSDFGFPHPLVMIYFDISEQHNHSIRLRTILSPLLALSNCDWPTFFKQSCIPDPLIPVYHFSIHLKQFKLPEDGGNKHHRNISPLRDAETKMETIAFTYVKCKSSRRAVWYLNTSLNPAGWRPSSALTQELMSSALQRAVRDWWLQRGRCQQ